MNFSRFFVPAITIMLILTLSACASRSISNSGYTNDSYRGHHQDSDFEYKGELTELQILGIDPKSVPTEEDILRTLDQAKSIKLAKDSNILLIQSGAVIPDEGMAQSLGKYFSVGPYTGVPEQNTSNENYSKLIRLIAARGGYETIVCYWGILESGKMNQATKTISWVPVVGWSLPDQQDLMRIRLKVALLDVRSGSWSVFMPQPFADSDYSSMVSRKDVDQALVQTLKEKAYSAAADDLYRRYVN